MFVCACCAMLATSGRSCDCASHDPMSELPIDGVIIDPLPIFVRIRSYWLCDGCSAETLSDKYLVSEG